MWKDTKWTVGCGVSLYHPPPGGTQITDHGRVTASLSLEMSRRSVTHSVYQWWRHADAGSKAEMPFCRKWIETNGSHIRTSHGGKHKNICLLGPLDTMAHGRGTLPYWTNAALGQSGRGAPRRAAPNVLFMKMEGPCHGHETSSIVVNVTTHPRSSLSSRATYKYSSRSRAAKSPSCTKSCTPPC
jgi:hypothetical protein